MQSLFNVPSNYQINAICFSRYKYDWIYQALTVTFVPCNRWHHPYGKFVLNNFNGIILCLSCWKCRWVALLRQYDSSTLKLFCAFSLVTIGTLCNKPKLVVALYLPRNHLMFDGKIPDGITLELLGLCKTGCWGIWCGFGSISLL